MGTSARGDARRTLGRRLLLLLLGFGGLAALWSAAVGAAEGPTVEPAEGTTGFAWSPSSVALAPGGTLAIRNPSKVVPHGVAWTGGPEAPSCSGVPVNSSGTDWSGTCTFAEAGTYSFICTVHPEMRETVTVEAGATTPAPQPAPTPVPGPGAPAEQPPEGTALQAVRLTGVQHGAVVRGSLELAVAASGGKLTLELRARRRSQGARSGGSVRVGRLVRSQLKPGPQRFAIGLRNSARRALSRRRRLPLTLKIVVAPPQGSAVTRIRKVMLHV
jgi:plastocyanin